MLRTLMFALAVWIALVGVAPMMLVAESATPRSNENLIRNGHFDEGIEAWAATIKPPREEVREVPGMLAWPAGEEEADQSDENGENEKCLCLTFDGVAKKDVLPFQGGAHGELTEMVEGGATVKVRFRAKHVSGKRYVYVGRPHGGSEPEWIIELKPEWTTHEVAISFEHRSRTIVFAIVGSERGRRAGDGVCLLDDIHVSATTGAEDEGN